MPWIDRLFVSVFSHHRRTREGLGVGGAFRRATYEFDVLVSLPLVLASTACVVFALGAHAQRAEARAYAQPAAIFVALAVWLWTRNRFSKYQVSPPALVEERASYDRGVVIRFRLLSLSLGVALLVLMNRVGNLMELRP